MVTFSLFATCFAYLGFSFAAPVPVLSLSQGLDISFQLQNILDNTDKNPGYRYPTDFTRGIVPKTIHSHNDYWNPIPFYTALSVGCISIEADVWLLNGTLYVGHEESSLTPTRTLSSLYIQPILSVLHRQNPSSRFVTSPTKNGVFDTDSSQTLYLFIDVKTDGATTFPVVIQELEPLRSGGWLTTYDGSGITSGAVTVIGTGNTPLDQVQGVNQRDYFYDAPLPLLSSTFSNVTSNVSPIASTDFAPVFGTIKGTTFNSTQIATLRSQIATASSKGIKARYWDQPVWPLTTRNAIWKTLIDEGVGLINTDNVVEAAGFGGVAGYW